MLLSIIDILLILPLDDSFLHTYILEPNYFIKSVSNSFPDNFTIFFIPRVGCSIIFLVRSIIRELSNAS